MLRLGLRNSPCPPLTVTSARGTMPDWRKTFSTQGSHQRQSTRHRQPNVGGSGVKMVARYKARGPPRVAVYVLFRAGSLPDIAAGSAEEILKGSTLLVVSSSILGGLCSVLGGYVSARIAKHDEVLNGALSSILCVGSGVYTVINLSSAGPLWLHLAFLPLSPALGALGGYLRSRQNALRG
jgi:hypothetical protein